MREKKKAVENSPWRHHTPFQAVIEARQKAGRDITSKDRELSKKMYDYHHALEAEEKAMRERRLQEQMLARQNYEQFLRRNYYE